MAELLGKVEREVFYDIRLSAKELAAIRIALSLYKSTYSSRVGIKLLDELNELTQYE